MITFKQHLALTEDYQSELDPDMMGTFVADCSKFLKVITTGKNLTSVFFRGASSHPAAQKDRYNTNSLEMARRTLNARTPVDTDPVIHELMNDYFDEMFRIPFRDGMMITNQLQQAREYTRTDPLIIVPVNGTSYCYGDGVKDAHQSMYELTQLIDPDLNKNDIVKEFFKKFKYRAGENELKNALLKHVGEVMIFPKNGNTLEFYAFSQQYYFKKVLPEVKHYL